MQDNFCGYKPVKLSTEQKLGLEKTMSGCNKVLKDFNYSKSIRCLRDEYFSGELKLEGEVAEALQTLRSVESCAISGYILLAVKLSKKFYHAESRPGVTLEDFIQESALAIYDCVYNYSSKSRFSTFVSRAINNRIIDFTRKEKRISGDGGKISALKYVVVRYMNNLMSFEQAIEEIECETGEQIDYDIVCAVKDSLVEVDSLSNNLQVSYTSDNTDVEFMYEVISQTNLNDKERFVIERYIEVSGACGWQRSLSKEWECSHQNVNNIFKKACIKCTEKYEVFNRRMAA